MHARLAIVEDDSILLEELSFFFSSHGYIVDEANNYLSLLDSLKENEIGVIILDLNLPGKNGHEIAYILKQTMPHIGIIVLTARTSLVDRVKSYDMGADIYLPKPTDPNELLAAVKRLILRINGSSSTSTKFQLNPYSQELLSKDIYCRDLTALEIAILRALMLSPQQMLENGELLNLIEEKFSDRASSRRALENIISRLRKKLMVCFKDTQDPIKAIRGLGYQLRWSIEIVN